MSWRNPCSSVIQENINNLPIPANRSVFPKLSESDPIYFYLFGLLESGENGVLRYGIRFYEDFDRHKDLLFRFLSDRVGWNPWSN